MILRVNGRDVTPDETVSFLIAQTPVGARIPLDVIRDGRRQTVTVAVGQRPTEEELARRLGTEPEQEDGLAPENAPAIPGSSALGLQLSRSARPSPARSTCPPERGVVVAAVDPNSDAADKGLQRGDVIISINRQAVSSPAQVQSVVQSAQRAGRSSVLLLVKRGTAPGSLRRSRNRRPLSSAAGSFLPDCSAGCSLLAAGGHGHRV